MKVKELIEKLEKFDPETNIVFSGSISNNYSVVHGDDLDWCLREHENYSYTNENPDDDEDEMSLGQVVEIHVDGDYTRLD